MTRCCDASIKLTIGRKRESTIAIAIAITSAPTCQQIARLTFSMRKFCLRHWLRANLVGCVFQPGNPSRLTRHLLDARWLWIPTTRNTQTVKDYPCGVGTIECIKMNAGNTVVQKIVALFYREMEADAL